ncbi:MAG: UvrB/UvrC motif-containing protein [Planctomycetota bacterium]
MPETPDSPDESHLCGDCRKCGKKPVVTEITIKNGKKEEKQLCEECAKAQGLGTQSHAPINQLISNFVMSASGASKTRESAKATTCEACGLTFSEFRQSGLLGCSRCYEAFESQLGSLLERAHDGASHHVGKVPARAGSSVERQERIELLRRQLDEAIEAEEYERAAAVRDELLTYEHPDAADGERAGGDGEVDSL